MTRRKSTRTPARGSRVAAPPPPTSQETTTVDLGRFVSQIEDRIAEIDSRRAAGLSRLAQLTTARANILGRQRANAAAAGATDDVKAFDATIASETAKAASLAGLATLVAKPAPVPEAGEQIVHGLVHGANPAVKLSLVDDSGKTVATTTAAKDGHFVLRYRAKDEAAHPVELRVNDPRHPAPISVDTREPVSFVVVRLRG